MRPSPGKRRGHLFLEQGSLSRWLLSGPMLVHDPIGSKGDGIAKPGSNETQRGEGQGWGPGDVKSTSVTAT